jgi:hypothetical protein
VRDREGDRIGGEMGERMNRRSIEALEREAWVVSAILEVDDVDEWGHLSSYISRDNILLPRLILAVKYCIFQGSHENFAIATLTEARIQLVASPTN